MRCHAAKLCPLNPVCQERLGSVCPGSLGANLVLRLWERRGAIESVEVRVGEMREEASACGPACG